MQFITENELDSWVRGNSQTAQGFVVELVAKLVAASSPRPREKRFPLGDSIGQHGPDGHLDAIISFDPYVPEGRSFWEIGVGLDAQRKANSDYNDLTSTVPETIRKESTFIFVTPLSGRRGWEHSWKEDGQISWIQRKKETGEWKDVKIIDGTKLVDWIRQFIAIELWAANVTRSLNEYQVETLDQKWDLIKSIGEPPPLSCSLFLSNRPESTTRLSENMGSREVFKLKLNTHFPNELTAFVSAFVSSLDDDRRHDITSRTVIVSGVDAWNNLCNRNENLILVAESSLDLNGDSGIQLIQKAKKANHSVIYSGPRGGMPDPGSVQLAMPRRHHVEEDLKMSGYSDERARVLAQQCNGNLSTLLRCIQNLSSIPEWAQNTHGDDLKIISLIGSWDELAEADKVFVEEVVGKPYGEWILRIRNCLSISSTPLIFRDNKWKLASRYEAWYSLGSKLVDSEIKRFAETAVKVLKQRDPQFDVEKSERYASKFMGTATINSKLLRNGIGDTVALLGSHSDALSLCASRTGETTAAWIVQEVLKNAQWQQWATLNDLMPLLAEAAPHDFLAIVESELNKDVCVFDQIFAQEGAGILGGTHISGLLWALETLAWDKKLLNRTTNCLGLLAKRDPGGQWANRPGNSLRHIYLPWYPQTTASKEKRLLTVKNLLVEMPTVGWKLILELLPDSHSATSVSRKPAWRNYISEDWTSGVTNLDYSLQVNDYCELAIESAKGNVERIVDLIESVESFPESFHNALLEYLSAAEFLVVPESDRSLIWDALKNIISRHRQFSSTNWALPKVTVDKMSEVANIISPHSKVFLYRRLFANRAYDSLDEVSGIDRSMKKLTTAQEAAALDIYSLGGLSKTIEFLSMVDMPWNVGRALGVVGPRAVDVEALPSLFYAQAHPVKQFIASFIASRVFTFGWPWVAELLALEWSKDELATFLGYLPFVCTTWDYVESFLGSQESLYWARASVNAYQEKVQLGRGIKKLVKYGRPNAALDCIYKMVIDNEHVDTEVACEALIDSLKSNEPINSMDGYQVVQVIKYLQNEPTTPTEMIFKVEWAYLQLLDRDQEAAPQVLEGKLAKEPGFFCEVIRLVYRSKDALVDEVTDLDPLRKAFATNGYRLLNGWSRVPGTLDDGTFDKTIFLAWLSSVTQSCIQTGHYEVAMLSIGRVLIHSKPDNSGLWIDKSISEVLNAKNNFEMRNGFRTALYNERGVFWFSSGVNEKNIADGYREKAEALEDAGFRTFADTLTSLAEDYDRQSARDMDPDRETFDD